VRRQNIWHATRVELIAVAADLEALQLADDFGSPA